MVRHAPANCQSGSDRPAKARSAAHFDRNERYAYFGNRTLARVAHKPREQRNILFLFV
jgi:hypothetical protein